MLLNFKLIQNIHFNKSYIGDASVCIRGYVLLKYVRLFNYIDHLVNYI